MNSATVGMGKTCLFTRVTKSSQVRLVPYLYALTKETYYIVKEIYNIVKETYYENGSSLVTFTLAGEEGDIFAGGRALQAVLRPYAVRTSGMLISVGLFCRISRSLLPYM